MEKEDIPNNQWVEYLTKVLSGRPAQVFTHSIPEDVKKSYQATKNVLLAAVGLSHEHYVHQFWDCFTHFNSSPEEVVQKSTTILTRLWTGLDLAQFRWKMLKLHILNCYASECVAYVKIFDPQDCFQLIDVLRNYEEAHGKAIKYKPRKQVNPGCNNDRKTTVNTTASSTSTRTNEWDSNEENIPRELYAIIATNLDTNHMTVQIKVKEELRSQRKETTELLYHHLVED